MQNIKSTAIKAIMGNGNLSSLVFDALKSPIGSSKREKAASILRSVGITNTMDGQGGMPDTPYNIKNPYETQGMSIAPQKKTIPSTIFSKPTPKVEQKTETVQDIPRIFPTIPEVPSLKEGDVRINPQTGKEETYLNVSGSSTPKASFVSDNAPYSIDTWYNNLGENEKKQFSPLYEAYQRGVGSKTFAYEAMGDTEKLKKLFPNTPEELLPKGASVFDQVNTLEKQLKEELKLDETQKRLSELQNSGITIESDLTGYMKTRDKYIKKLDDMIDDTLIKRTTTDISDPKTAKVANNYLNYLYVLKGRQQKRYADFLKDGVAYNKAKVEEAKNNYTSLKKQFDDGLANIKEMTKEKYQVFNNLLEEMYDNINKREENGIKAITTQSTLINALNNIAENSSKQDVNTVYDNTKKLLESNKGIDGYVDTEIYKKERNKAKDKGIFDDNFSYLLNPNDPTAKTLIPSSLKVRTPLF